MVRFSIPTIGQRLKGKPARLEGDHSSKHVCVYLNYITYHLTRLHILFLCYLFYEWEHRTGTVCPFSSLCPLRKGR